jgi:methionine-rich copper-binding protein CopC
MMMANIGKPHADGVVLHVPIQKALPAGKYSLECRVVGPDSHPVNNTLTFAVSTK